MKTPQLSRALTSALQAALRHHQAGERSQAHALYRKVLRERPKQPMALHYCGLLLADSTQASESTQGVAMMEQSIALAPANVECCNDLGFAYRKRGEPDRASRAWRHALALKSDHADALRALGSLFIDQGRPAEALPYLEKLLALNPAEALAHCDLASCLAMLERYAEAAGHYEVALELRPDLANAWNNLAWIRSMMGRNNEAADLYRRAVALKPDYTQAHARLGRLLWAGRRFREAADALRAAATLASADATLFHDLGCALTELESYDEAIACLKTAVELDPASSAARDLVATRFAHAGRHDARQAFAASGNLLEVRRLSGVRAYCESGQGDYRKIAPAQTFRIPDPAFIGARFDAVGGEGETNELYVAEVRDATILSRCSLVLAGEDTVLGDVLAHPLGRHVDPRFEGIVKARHGNDLMLDRAGLRNLRAESGIHLTGASSANYGHWFAEYLPRLKLLAQHPDYRHTPIYVDQDMPRAHRQMLDAIAGGDHRVEIIAPGNSVTFERLLVAPTWTFFPFVCKPDTPQSVAIGSPAVEAYRFLRDEVLAALGVADGAAPATGRRLFLARQSRGRALINEEAVQDLYARHGFEIVFPERLGFAEQVALFNEAACVAGPNGSAFINAIFCRPGTRIICFVQHHGANFAATAHLFESLGLTHLYVAGNAIAGSSWHEHHLDYEIPLALAGEALDRFGLAPR